MGYVCVCVSVVALRHSFLSLSVSASLSIFCCFDSITIIYSRELDFVHRAPFFGSVVFFFGVIKRDQS